MFVQSYHYCGIKLPPAFLVDPPGFKAILGGYLGLNQIEKKSQKIPVFQGRCA